MFKLRIGLALLAAMTISCGDAAVQQPDVSVTGDTAPSIDQDSSTSTAISLRKLLEASSSNDIVVPAGTVAEIDEDIELGLIHVKGELRCADNVVATVRLEGMLIEGQGAKLACGSTTSPFGGKLRFELIGHRELSELVADPPHPFGGKAIVAMMMGTISLHGTPPSKHTRLDAHLNQGAAEITLADTVNWKPGDQIVVTTTSFYPDRNEQMTLGNAGSGKSFAVQPTATYFHYGQTQEYVDEADGETYVLDERAYVANLSRRIVIESEEDAHTAEGIGAHVMIMHHGFGYVDGVEFHRVGQMGKLGRYPFHWHQVGDVSGQYIRNSSIHRSFSRCVTIHNSHQAEVTDNVCYDHFGHGYFLEEGNETKNVLRGNLGIFSRKPPQAKALLLSDINSQPADRFPGPATYWISNPDNDVRDNVASGSEGSGFWMAFVKALNCPDGKNCVKAEGGAGDVTPVRTDTLAFSNNVAHSTVCGITWDGAPDGELTGNPLNANDRKLVNAHYGSPTVPSFDDLVVYKNSRAGIYFRGEQAHFPRAIFADNGTSAFFAYNQVISDGLIVGFSANHDAGELGFHFDPAVPFPAQWRQLFEGIRVYDGPFVLDNVFFAGFPSQPVYSPGGKELTPTPLTLNGAAMRYGNVVSGLTFSPEPYRRYQISPIGPSSHLNWQDAYAASLTDLDGSLTGVAGAKLRPAHPMNDHASCVTDEMQGAMVCQYAISFLRLQAGEYSKQKFNVKRSDGPQFNFNPSDPKAVHYNKFSLIHIADLGYLIKQFDFKQSQKLYLEYVAKTLGTVSPAMGITSAYNLPAGCTLANLSLNKGISVGTINELIDATETAYHGDATGFYFKIQADAERPNLSAGTMKGRNTLEIRCP